jgi:hypothetical protein
MGLFNKKTDPISERARALSEEIAALEAQIKRLDTKQNAAQNSGAPAPRLRSTAIPHGSAPHTQSLPQPAPTPREPIFEEVDQQRLQAKRETVTKEHYNDLGVRKYDLAALMQRIKNHFRGPSTANPKLVNYLAAGSIQGLRPMRYEKRVARNRFLFIVIGLLLLLVGIFAILRKKY